ncbi:MAG TPA: phage tail tube protein [Candidatus Wallbacteria bacterium]|nr:phage tail tube protein [Candidatus Wallbacteria bacterium]
MANGIESKILIIHEDEFGVYASGNTKKRIEVTENSVLGKYDYKDPETISGELVKAPNIQTKKTVEGGNGIICAPENGFPEFLKYALGSVTTYAGEFKRERQTNKTGTFLSVNTIPVTVGSDFVWKKATGGVWTKLTRVVSDPTANQYSISIAAGEITLGTAAVSTDEFMITYCKNVAGVYSHVYRPGTRGSFQVWDTKGGIELFEFTGCKIDSFKLSINAEDFLQADCSIVSQDDALGSVTGHTFPEELTLSPLDPFIFKQAKAKLDWVDETMLEKIDIEIKNNVKARFSIRGADTCRNITSGKQEVSISTELEFVDMTYYNKFRNATFGVLEVVYGLVNGVKIGSTNVTYQFHIFIPNFRFESADVPTTPDTLVIASEGFANRDAGLGFGYEMVVVNSQPAIA